MQNVYNYAMLAPAPVRGLRGTSLLRMADLDVDRLATVLDVARHLKRSRGAEQLTHLRGKTLAMLFEKPSLRTRVSFEVAMTQLGGHALYATGADFMVGSRETPEDAATVLSRYVDAIVVRTHAHDPLERFAGAATVPVINGLSAAAHPCQALADLLTIAERFGTLRGLRVAYIGDGRNNVAASLAEAAMLSGVSMTFGTGGAAGGDSQIVSVGGSVERLDLAGWLKLSTPDKNAKPLSYYMRAARLDVAELDYLGLAFHDVSLDLAVAEGSWRISVGGPNVIGSITIPSASGSTDPWNLQFDRLRFEVPDASADTPPGGDSTGFADPRGIPAINFHATELIWGERKFGEVTATITKLDDGISLKQLAVTAPNFNVSAIGEWRGKDAGTCRIQGTLASSDVESTLKDLGYAEGIRAKSGKMVFDLSWSGAPTTAAVTQAAGHIQLSLDKGEVTGLKPGAGRVLGLSSIAELPRRLALDFSDLTDKGLAFDTVRGDFDLRDGNAYTDNVLLKGPAAEIGLIGRVGLKNKDYDQTAVVTGNVGSSLSLPLAGALVAGPIGAGAVLLFQQVFKQPLKGLARGYYRITGGWDNPTVERIKSAAAAAATAEAPK